MYYLLYNKQLNKHLIYDELSDTLLKMGWRMIREVSNSEVDIEDFNINKAYLKDYEKFEFKYKNALSNRIAFNKYCEKLTFYPSAGTATYEVPLSEHSLIINKMEGKENA